MIFIGNTLNRLLFPLFQKKYFCSSLYLTVDELLLQFKTRYSILSYKNINLEMNSTQKIYWAHCLQQENQKLSFKQPSFMPLNKEYQQKNIKKKLNFTQNNNCSSSKYIITFLIIFLIVFGFLKISGYKFQINQLETIKIPQVQNSIKRQNTIQIRQEINLMDQENRKIFDSFEKPKNLDETSQSGRKSILLIEQSQQPQNNFRKIISKSSKTQEFQHVRVIPKQEMERIMEKFRMNNLKLNTISNKSGPKIRPGPIHLTNSAGITQEQVDSASFYISLKDTIQENEVSRRERNYFEQKYNISSYKTELPICVVIPSYNNVQNNRYKANINSILQQNYKNFHIVFIDDASTDQTFEKTLQLINERQFPLSRVNMIKNDKQMFAMHNLRRAAFEFCKPEQIFIIVDGDDELVGRQVFNLYNALFQSTNSYFIYTNFMTPRGSIGYSRPIDQMVKQTRDYRSFPFVISHLRAFYTKLFQLVKQDDLRDQNGIYFHAANDVAICLPILEMSGQRVEYFPQITYLYNSETGLNNHMIRLSEQKANDNKIRRKQKYGLLQNLFEK